MCCYGHMLLRNLLLPTAWIHISIDWDQICHLLRQAVATIMMSKFNRKGRLLSQWNRMYLRATDLDHCNQVYEAAAQYDRLGIYYSIFEDNI